jgi:hypothetical protein
MWQIVNYTTTEIEMEVGGVNVSTNSKTSESATAYTITDYLHGFTDAVGESGTFWTASNDDTISSAYWSSSGSGSFSNTGYVSVLPTITGSGSGSGSSSSWESSVTSIEDLVQYFTSAYGGEVNGVSSSSIVTSSFDPFSNPQSLTTYSLTSTTAINYNPITLASLDSTFSSIGWFPIFFTGADYDDDGNVIDTYVVTFWEEGPDTGTVTTSIPTLTSYLSGSSTITVVTSVTSETESLLTYTTTGATTGLTTTNSGVQTFDGSIQYMPSVGPCFYTQLSGSVVSQATYYADTDQGEYFIVNTGDDNSALFEATIVTSFSNSQVIDCGSDFVAWDGNVSVSVPLSVVDFTDPQTETISFTFFSGSDVGIDWSDSVTETVGECNQIPWGSVAVGYCGSITGSGSNLTSSGTVQPVFAVTSSSSYESEESNYTAEGGTTNSRTFGGSYSVNPLMSPQGNGGGVVGGASAIFAPVGNVMGWGGWNVNLAASPDMDFSSFASTEMGWGYITADAEFAVGLPEWSVRPGVCIPAFFETTSTVIRPWSWWENPTSTADWTFMDISRLDNGRSFFSTWSVTADDGSGSTSFSTQTGSMELSLSESFTFPMVASTGSIVGGARFPAGGSYRLVEAPGATRVRVYEDSGSTVLTSSNDGDQSYVDSTISSALSIFEIYPYLPAGVILVAEAASDPGL